MRRLPGLIAALLLAGCAGFGGEPVEVRPVLYTFPPECLNTCLLISTTCKAGCGNTVQCVLGCNSGPYRECLSNCKVPIATPTPSPDSQSTLR